MCTWWLINLPIKQETGVSKYGFIDTNENFKIKYNLCIESTNNLSNNAIGINVEGLKNVYFCSRNLYGNLKWENLKG